MINVGPRDMTYGYLWIPMDTYGPISEVRSSSHKLLNFRDGSLTTRDARRSSS